VDALAALRREERHDVVAGLDESDVLTHRFDDTRPLVPENRRGVARRVGAGRGVEIGVADAAGDEPDEHLPRLGLGKVDLLDRQGTAELLEHGGADPHGRRSPGASIIR
jgi:hypothetical protein